MDAFEILARQRYKIHGHAAVKLCLWTKKSVRGLGFCYKEKFYGIKSHRCVQCTPSVAWCTLRCTYCWRPITEASLGCEIPEELEPKEVVDSILRLHNQLLTGLGGVPHDPEKLREARSPKHAAISLAGEPMIYSRMSGLLSEFHRRGMTTFLVTNGTLPERIEALETLPTQFYISVCSPTEKHFRKVHAPEIRNGWPRLLRSLELMRDMNTRRVVRLTLAKGLNFELPEKYAELISIAEPDFVEVKAAMPVGFAKDRLKYSQMPLHREIREFSEKISELLGYRVENEKPDSRVVLLSSGRKKPGLGTN